MLTDTVGFFDYCIPLTNESHPPASDSLLKYYDFSVYNYITPPPPHKQYLQTTSLFRPHNLAPKHSGPMAINQQGYDWITIVFLVCLFLFAWIQTSYSKRLSQIFRAVAQPHYVNQLEREGNLFKERIILGLGLNYYLISSIFAFQIFSMFSPVPPRLNSLTLTGIIFGGIFLYQMLKSAIIYLTGIIFETGESARQYQLIILIFNYIIGIVLFPVVVIAFYWNSTALLITGIVITSLLLLYRLARGVLSGQSNKDYNLFYLFLYLCTLEILPLLLIFKVISKM
jgi:MFS family permease